MQGLSNKKLPIWLHYPRRQYSSRIFTSHYLRLAWEWACRSDYPELNMQAAENLNWINLN